MFGSLPASRPSSAAPSSTVWPFVAAAAAGAIVYHRALGYFFSSDDFAWLSHARGLLPRLTGPWRYLSAQAYYDAMRPLAGLNPLPYHLVSLTTHLVSAIDRKSTRLNSSHRL